MIKEAILKLAQRNDLTAQEALEVMNETSWTGKQVRCR